MQTKEIIIFFSSAFLFPKECNIGNFQIVTGFSVFPSGFPDIPRKISAYLRADSSLGANTRIMRGLCNILNINDLYLKGFLTYCEKHHFGMRNGLFRVLKCTISHPEMGLIGLRNGQYQKAG